ncbi:PE family protein, partial [Mycobacterium simulans]|uniref:PE family protein n=1 Tax=Mycobacterium simulans TaxID=627089 RepID=UPI00163E7B9F
MSYVLADLDVLAVAAGDVAGIGSSVSAANAAAAAATTGLLAAAGDEVSAAIARLFSSHGEQYQALSVQAAGFHEQFVRALSNAGGSYALAEAAAASPLDTVLALINGPTQLLLGRPLIGNGSDGAAGTGAGGGGGGIPARLHNPGA